MSLPLKLSDLGGAATLHQSTTAATRASKHALREIETRFAAELLDAALPKAKSMFGKGVAGTLAREQFVNRIADVLSNGDLLGIAKSAGARIEGHAEPARGGVKGERRPP